MVKGVCVNGTMMNNNNYSSPIPLVGLYIATASMVCFFLVLCDVWAGFRNKKYWFPCRFFSINSITLTLISIATKIPVDLTTQMPSKQDQLSKLCGTVFICVAMIFMLPSIATNAEFESYANVTALSIFVITVAVNICIQMATGVIFSFIAEHIIILICMLLLLPRFWLSVTCINVLKRDKADKGIELIRNGEGNMLARLKICYVYGYQSCLQLYACMNPVLGDASLVCMLCSTILVQATFRSLALEDLWFCEGTSDYGWSMWLVVANQILTVSIVTFAIGGRWLMHSAHFPEVNTDFGQHETYLQFQYLFSLRNIPKLAEKTFKFVIYLPLFYCHAVLVLLTLLVELVLVLPLGTCDLLNGLLARLTSYDCVRLGNYLCKVEEICDRAEGFKEQLSSRDVVVQNWVLNRAVADLEILMQRFGNGNASQEHVTSFLSTVLPSRRQSSYYIGFNGEGVRISCLSLVLLAEIAKAVIKSTTQAQDKVSLAKVLHEVFGIIHYIESKVNIGSSEDRLRFTVAKVIQKYGLASGLSEYILEHNWDLEDSKVNFEFIQKPVCGMFPIKDSVTICIRKAGSEVNDFINYRPVESTEALHGRIEQLFADMLHTFLAQLPVAIFADIMESPSEKYQERVRLGLGYMCKLRSIESHVRFVLPSGNGISSLFNTPTSSTVTQAQGPPVQEVSTFRGNIVPAVEDIGEIQEDAQITEHQL